MSIFSIYKCLSIFAKFINNPPIFVQFTFFCLIYGFCFPYFDHDVFKHHALDCPLNLDVFYVFQAFFSMNIIRMWRSLRRLVYPQGAPWLCSINYSNLSYIAEVGLWAPPSRSLEEALYKFSEWMNVGWSRNPFPKYTHAHGKIALANWHQCSLLQSLKPLNTLIASATSMHRSFYL